MTPRATALSDADLRAIGTLIEGRPDRIAAIAAQLQHGGRLLESRVRGTSMGQALRDGVAIRIELCTADHYRRGDVVAFLVGSRLTVHRVVVSRCWPRQAVMITRGDGRVFPDPPLRSDQVLGRVIAVQVDDGRWERVPARERQSLPFALAAAGVTACMATTTALFGPRVARAVAWFVYRRLLPGRADRVPA